MPLLRPAAGLRERASLDSDMRFFESLPAQRTPKVAEPALHVVPRDRIRWNDACVHDVAAHRDVDAAATRFVGQMERDPVGAARGTRRLVVMAHFRGRIHRHRRVLLPRALLLE